MSYVRCDLRFRDTSRKSLLIRHPWRGGIFKKRETLFSSRSTTPWARVCAFLALLCPSIKLKSCPLEVISGSSLGREDILVHLFLGLLFQSMPKRLRRLVPHAKFWCLKRSKKSGLLPTHAHQLTHSNQAEERSVLVLPWQPISLDEKISCFPWMIGNHLHSTRPRCYTHDRRLTHSPQAEVPSFLCIALLFQPRPWSPLTWKTICRAIISPGWMLHHCLRRWS